MRSVSITEVQPDSVLAMPVFGVDGKVLLHKGVRVTSSYINALRKKGISTLFDFDLVKLS